MHTGDKGKGEGEGQREGEAAMVGAAVEGNVHAVQRKWIGRMDSGEACSV